MLKFYQARPILKLHAVPTVTGTMSLSIDDATTAVWGEDANRVYWLGVLSTDYVLPGEQHHYGFESWLAGTDGINRNSGHRLSFNNFQPLDILPATQSITQRDLSLGEESLRFDPIRNSLSVTTPFEGTITIGMAYGHCGNESVNAWDIIEYQFLDLVSDLASQDVIESIIQTRSGVVLSSDTQFDVGSLQSTLERLAEKNEQNLAAIAMPVMFFG